MAVTEDIDELDDSKALDSVKNEDSKMIIIAAGIDGIDNNRNPGKPSFPDYLENELISLGLFSEVSPFLDSYPDPFSDPLKN